MSKNNDDAQTLQLNQKMTLQYFCFRKCKLKIIQMKLQGLVLAVETPAACFRHHSIENHILSRYLKLLSIFPQIQDCFSQYFSEIKYSTVHLRSVLHRTWQCTANPQTSCAVAQNYLNLSTPLSRFAWKTVQTLSALAEIISLAGSREKQHSQ